jgi:hypothetical protein
MSSRVVKVPLPVDLIRRMDEAIGAQRGGFQTRAELMREAVENLLTELDFPDAPPEPAGRRTAAAGPAPTDGRAGSMVSIGGDPMVGLDQAVAGLPAWERDELRLADLVDTALEPPRRPVLLPGGVATVRDEPLLGLHNRDYVSVWAIDRLARYTEEGPIPFDDYMRRVTRAAWFFGSQLQALEAVSAHQKLAVLFPTNFMKQPSAERGFQAFAVGSLAKRADARHELRAGGPLFAWKAIQITEESGLPTGLTEAGWELLTDLTGVSLRLPHSPELMLRFMAYLERHAPADRWGFDHVVTIVAEGPDRHGLIESFAETHPEWSAATASSTAQGYIARAREWGLVEPRLLEGRYWLTDVGRQFAQEIK